MSLLLQTSNTSLYYKEKSALLQALFILCLVSVSRILFYAIIYLGLPSLTGSSDSPSRTKALEGTILHIGKDFAVSPLLYNKIIPTLANWALAFRRRRHCSHLLDRSRWGLPTTLSRSKPRYVFGLSSSPLSRQRNHSTRDWESIAL